MPDAVACIDRHPPYNGVPPVFQKVLIANRGEIALRILRTLKGMGLVTVVAHHALDADLSLIHI